MLKFRPSYLIATLLLFAIELYIALDVRDAIIRPYGGDFLVVILIYCFVRAFVNWSVVRAAIAVFVFACFVELLQYFKIVEVLHLQSSSWARIIIGTSFAWSDILAYALGIATVLAIELIWLRMRGKNSKASS